MDVHQFDRWGLHLPACEAFTQGLRVELTVCNIGEQYVVAEPVCAELKKVQYHCVFPSGITSFLRTGMTLTVVDFVVTNEDNTMVVRSAQGPLLPLIYPDDIDNSLAEGFAGLGGWSCGAKLCGCKTRVLVEWDRHVAVTCSMNHNLPCLEMDEAINLMMVQNLPLAFVLIGDMTDFRTYAIVSWLGIAS